MRLLLLTAALAVVSSGLDDCSRGACYPPSGDLLLGREQQLHASSTCGLHGSEVVCTPFQQWKMKCCPCDSRNPDSRLAHTVQDILSTAGKDRWWQSRKDVNPVTLQLDLNNLFQLDNLVLTFKGPRPNSFIVEKTLDNGKTWQPALYIADDCRSAFPDVATTTPRTMDQTYCYTMPPIGPYSDQIINFSPLQQYSYVPLSRGQKIQAVSGLTGLRVRLTELGDVPRLPGRASSRFYALREMRVVGSCMCHGHANRCHADDASDRLTTCTEVGAQCECQHNTAGGNCERCADLYNDLPWRAAEEGDANACQRCECNNHAERCAFDPAVYEASGRTTGGVCEGCRHHTTGPRCEQCAPGYQPNPRSTMDRPDACTRCKCNTDGVMKGSLCDTSGSCDCKANVEGPHCERCKGGFYGLSASNVLGCTSCSCSPDGSSSSACDPLTGQCPCHAHRHGLTCAQCSPAHWKPLRTETCEACGCDPTKSLSNTCHQRTGQCECRPGFGGRTCTECPDNTYGDPLIGCRACRCAAGGTLRAGCDRRTGACACGPGLAGPLCDSCSRGHCGSSFPSCQACPSCFFSLDAQLRNLSLGLGRLSPGSPPPTTTPTDTDDTAPGPLGPRVRALEAKLNRVKDSISLPPISARQIEDALSGLSGLRDQMAQVDGDLSPLDGEPGLGSRLDELQALLDGLGLVYNAKRDGFNTSGHGNNKGSFSAIKNAYDESRDATESAAGSSETVERSQAVRGEARDQNQVQEGNTKDLDTFNQALASRPDLTPAAKQVCGSTRSTPCTPSQCEAGELCPPPEGAPPCGRGASCVGALPLGKRAVNDTEEVKERLEKLNDRITETEEQLQTTKETANKVRMTSESLSNQMKRTRDDLEADLKDTRDVIKELKDFLSDPSSKLTQVKEVSDWVLNAKLPLSLADLKGKLQELKDLAAGLPDSTAVLEEAEPLLDLARRLLREARDARDVALGTKEEVDTLLEGLGTVEGSLSGLEDKVQESMDIIDDLNGNLNKTKAQLSPAERTLREVSALAEGMKPDLVDLRTLLLSAGRLADEASGEAQSAKEEAAAAARELAILENQLKLLKSVDANSGRGDGAGSAGDRVKRLRDDAVSLAKDTAGMMEALSDKADSLRRLQGLVLQKSQRLGGLDAKLQGILTELLAKAKFLSTCMV